MKIERQGNQAVITASWAEMVTLFMGADLYIKSHNLVCAEKGCHVSIVGKEMKRLRRDINSIADEIDGVNKNSKAAELNDAIKTVLSGGTVE